MELLLEQSLQGNQRAYALLLIETSRFLRQFLIKRLNLTHELEDILQEILISLHKARHTYDGCRPYKPWVYAIAKFRLQDYLRVHYSDQLRQAIDFDELEESYCDYSSETALSYESIRVQVQMLPEKQATILRLMHQDGFTAKEVAEKLGMNQSAVKVSAHRAYKILKEKLGR